MFAHSVLFLFMINSHDTTTPPRSPGVLSAAD
eukprot:COSAG06_NODE_5669_length_3331_cov_2.810496_1_plen_31_part_10